MAAPCGNLALTVFSLIGIATSAVISERANDFSVTISRQTPNGASDPIDVNFPGFAFEVASVPRWLGNKTHKNEFTNALMNQILSRTGGIPIIRSGGTSGDNANYNPNQGPAVTGYDPSVGVGKLKLVIGPKYFDSFHNVPNAKYIPQFPLHHDNLTDAVDWASDGIPAIGLDNINALEIGNEPAGYVNEEQYVQRWHKFQDAIIKAVPTVAGKVIWQGIDGASGANIGFNGTQIMEDGLDDNKLLKQVAYHYYQTTATASTTLQSTLLNHTLTTSKLDVYKPFLKYMKQNYPNIPVLMNEVGNSLRDASNPNPQTIQSVLGSALWAVDFQLYIMSLGFGRVNMQQLGYNEGYNLWVPEQAPPAGSPPPQVLPPFYAQPMVADFISKGGNTRVVNIDLNSRTHSAYGAYENGSLKRLVIVNLAYWDGTGANPAPRPMPTVTVNLGTGNDAVTIKYLTAPNGAPARQGLAWDNTQWTFQNPTGTPSGRDDSKTAKVNNGKLTIVVPASSAAMVIFP